MDKSILAFLFLFVVASVAMAGEQRFVSFDNLIGPPQIIEYQSGVHAVFDMGGMQYLFKVTEEPKPYPQCDAIQAKGKELMVVGHNPKGYAYFVETTPIAFKTDHNPNWDEIVKRTHD